MIKIITTKHYKAMQWNIEMGDLLLELAEKVMRRQEIEIEKLQEKVKSLEDGVDELIEQLVNKPEKEIVKVYKLQVKPDLNKRKGVKFSGTKKQLDKFIYRNDLQRLNLYEKN